jgi:trimeric autotransporter adhesin
MKHRHITFTTILLLGVLALSSIVQAVSPAPDGGYPGFNTAEGQNALFSLSTGVGNTAIGWFSLWSNTEGSFNTAVGAGTLLFNVGDQSTGEGTQNTAIGAVALFNNTTGESNTANGASTLFHNTTGYNNCAFGANALFSNNDGAFNTAVGSDALFSNTAGSFNTAIGDATLVINTGSENTGVGYAALNANVAGISNTATGSEALEDNSSGNFNTADGYLALQDNSTGSANTAVGVQALQFTSGNSNTAVGYGAGVNINGGNNNIAIGVNAGSNVTTANDTICIGIVGVNVTDGCYIGHVFEEPLDPDNLPMAIDVNGKVGTLPSSRRFKEHIKPMEKTSEAILALRPVTFDYKNDKNCSPRFGLIAEEVAEVDRNLVALDKNGKPYSVRYDQVNAMLLNEFLKEHRKVEELQAIVAQQQSTNVAEQTEMKALACALKQQAAQIQKVSDQVALSRTAPRVVSDNP